jgi:hypothetical protein
MNAAHKLMMMKPACPFAENQNVPGNIPPKDSFIFCHKKKKKIVL